LAACLFVLDPPREAKAGLASFGWPGVWVLVGTLMAFVSDAIYVRLSGLPADRFTSSLSSDLLVYRLFPNATYAVGVLPAILIASAPLAAALWDSRSVWRKQLNPAAQVFVAGALAVLLAGGLVVSLKIGGGSNLHNLDAYLVLLVVAASLLLVRPTETRPSAGPRLTFGLAASIVAVPIAFVLGVGGPWPQHDQSAASESLRVVQEQVAVAAEAGTRVLFISQRHLLTFGMVPAVPLEPDYETVFLMEMAMSGNRSYLDRFHAQLRDHDFGLIVVDRLATTYQGRGHSFGEENDAWVREVSLPILCSYEPEVNLEVPRIELLVPRSGSAACPE
jgi:hypothetical protein